MSHWNDIRRVMREQERWLQERRCPRQWKAVSWQTQCALRAWLSEKENKETPHEGPWQPTKPWRKQQHSVSSCFHQLCPGGPHNGSYWNDSTLPLVGAWLEDMRRTLPPIVLSLGAKVLGLCKNWKTCRERKGSPGYHVCWFNGSRRGLRFCFYKLPGDPMVPWTILWIASA